MPLPVLLALGYLLAISIIGFLLCFIDKHSSQVFRARRIPEMTFYILCLMGGTLGVLLGMYTFRHKTKKVSFQAVVIIILAIQAFLFFFLYPELSLPPSDTFLYDLP